MKLKKSFNIVARIASGYALIISMLVIISIFCIMILSKNNKIFTADLSLVSPLKDFSFLVSESKKLTGYWIYSSNNADKDSLKQLQTQTYPELKSTLLTIAYKLDDANEQL